jgi:hypothetical protein
MDEESTFKMIINEHNNKLIFFKYFSIILIKKYI